jgi:hypothetical protein
MMKFSPLAGLRAARPFGKENFIFHVFFYLISLGVRIMKYFQPDLRVKFEKLFDDDRILVYLYHCYAQIPTGEQGFRTISDLLAWAKGFIKFSFFLLK